jgi:hypothetical protein
MDSRGIRKSKKYRTNFKEKLILKSIDIPIIRLIFILEKQTRLTIRKLILLYFNFKKKIKNSEL